VLVRVVRGKFFLKKEIKMKKIKDEVIYRKILSSILLIFIAFIQIGLILNVIFIPQDNYNLVIISNVILIFILIFVIVFNAMDLRTLREGDG